MLLDFISYKLQPRFPKWLYKVLRKIGTAFLTPISFSYGSGHFKSSLKSLAVDKNNKPLIWYTYPIIDLLTAKDLSNYNVLEWGAGNSTKWWGLKVKEVISFEDKEDWYNRIKTELNPNCHLFLTDSFASNHSQILKNKKFDLIIIDGLNRFACAQISLEHLEIDGAIIFDNSEGDWSENDSDYTVMKLYINAGFSRVDYYGFAPGNPRKHCTSIFYKDSTFLFDGKDYPKLH